MSIEMSNFFDKIRATLPQTEEDWQKLHTELFNELQENKNNFSYWYPKVKDCGIKMAESHVYKLDFEAFDLIGDLYELRCSVPTDEFYQSISYKRWQNKIKLMTKYLKPKTYNIKTGTFSNKFNFESCICSKNEIPSKVLDLLIKDFEYEANGYSEFVVRDVIESAPDAFTIYNGLPLNFEIRVFYDFDKHEVMYSHNYWDFDYCKPHMTPSDKAILEIESSRFNYLYNRYHQTVENLVDKYMSNVQLEGQWSIDLMFNQAAHKYYLIDMAIAQQSAYYKGYVSD